MKNKVIALSLLITAMSIVPAFAATNNNCISNDLNNSNSNCYILKKGVGNSIIHKGFIIYSNCVNNGQTNKPENKPNNNCGNINRPNKPNKPSVPSVPSAPVKPEKPNKPEVPNKPSVPSNGSVSNYERQVVELVNAERSKNGLAPLTLDNSVSKVARVKSQDMATNNYFSHTSPTYGGAGQMLTQFGVKWSAYGENIASGQKTPQQVVDAWMNSSGHRANILSSNFTKIGVGYATNSKGTPYWTQMFTR